VNYEHESRKGILQSKTEWRRLQAAKPFESKLRAMLQMQRMNLEMKKAVGRKAPRPWNMSEESYLRETRQTP
jgi:hypothetical protein